jgi:hypothetical protein
MTWLERLFVYRTSFPVAPILILAAFGAGIISARGGIKVDRFTEKEFKDLHRKWGV